MKIEWEEWGGKNTSGLNQNEGPTWSCCTKRSSSCTIIQLRTTIPKKRVKRLGEYAIALGQYGSRKRCLDGEYLKLEHVQSEGCDELAQSPVWTTYLGAKCVVFLNGGASLMAVSWWMWRALHLKVLLLEPTPAEAAFGGGAAWTELRSETTRATNAAAPAAAIASRAEPTSQLSAGTAPAATTAAQADPTSRLDIGTAARKAARAAASGVT